MHRPARHRAGVAATRFEPGGNPRTLDTATPAAAATPLAAPVAAPVPPPAQVSVSDTATTALEQGSDSGTDSDDDDDWEEAFNRNKEKDDLEAKKLQKAAAAKAKRQRRKRWTADRDEALVAAHAGAALVGVPTDWRALSVLMQDRDDADFQPDGSVARQR